MHEDTSTDKAGRKSTGQQKLINGGGSPMFYE